MKRFLILILIAIQSCGGFSYTLKQLIEISKEPELIELKINQLNLELGAMRVFTHKNSKVFLMKGGKETIGLLIKNGRYKYTLQDKFIIPVALRNFKSAVNGMPEWDKNSLTFSEKTKFIVIWSPKLANKFSSKSTGLSSSFPSKVKKVLNGFLLGHPVLSLLFDRLYPKENFVTVYTDSGKNKLIYVRNPVYLKSETLFAVVKYPFRHKNLRGKYRVVPVATKTLNKHWFDKEKNIFFKTVKTSLNLINDKDEHIILTTKQTVVTEKDNLSAYVVNLISTVYRKRKIANYRVLSVKINGKNGDFAHINNLLFVKLDKKYKKGETFTIETKTEGNIAIKKNGSQRWVLGIWAWYPKPRHVEENSTFNITVATKKPFIAFASGNMVKRYSDKNFNYIETNLSVPSQYPVIAGGKYHTCERVKGDYRVIAGCYVNKKEFLVDKFSDVFFKAIDFYSQIFKTPYPFHTQYLVEGFSRGQAPPGLIFFSRIRTSNREGKFVMKIPTFQAFVHEIAHGYFGHTLKIPDSRELWISEALCQYSSLLCIMAIDPDKNEALDYYKTTIGVWKNQISKLNKGSILFFHNDFSGENISDRYDKNRLLYAKGPIIFLAINKKLKEKYGNKKGMIVFTAFLRDLLKEYRFKNLYTRDLIYKLNMLTGENWENWFEKYVLTEAIPDF